MVELAGFAFEAGGEPPEALVAPIRERLAVAPPAEASVLGNRELFGRLATSAMLAGMEQVCARWAPDLVLRDPCEYSSAVVAHRLGIPTAQVAISLAAVESASIATAAPALEEHRPGLVAELRSSPYLSRFPASLDPTPFPTTVRFSVPRPAMRGPLPNWWPGLGTPLVYLTFGTVLAHMSMASAVYRAALEAVASLPVRVLLTVGRHFDGSSLGTVPDNVHVEAWVDQAEVFREAALVVCHGGSGTSLGALEAGVPLVVVPLFADQFENGRRIAEAGAAIVVDSRRPAAPHPHGTPPVDAVELAAAITTALATPSLEQSAGRIAAEMAAAPTAADILATLLNPP